MDEAIKKLEEYRDWVLENEELAYWTSEEKIQDAIDCLKFAGSAEDFCNEQM